MADSPDPLSGARRTTMVDVARVAGVSFKTVSRVLNGEAYVRASTRNKVMQAARQLDYRFNHAARSLRSGTAQIVTLLVSNPSEAYMASVHLGALQQCQKSGLHVVMEGGDTGAAIDLAALDRALRETAPIGVVVTPPLCDDSDLIALLQRRDIPHVLISPRNPGAAASVCMDDEGAAREMTAHLIAQGHRRIGFIAGHPEHGPADGRLRGYRTALRDAGIDADDNLIVQGLFDWSSGLSCANRLLDLDRPPSAIFASNDDMAAAVISAAYARDLHVPRHLSVAGFDDTPVAGVISPRLTTIHQPIVEQVSEAVRMLANLGGYAGEAPQRIVLPHRLVERDSVGPAP